MPTYVEFSTQYASIEGAITETSERATALSALFR
jgi:hypothetical protein